MTGRALVLGGTGHLGAAIARSLAGAGWEVTASGRQAIARPNLTGTGVSIVTGDDGLPSCLEVWVQGRDLVVDAATPYPVDLYSRRSGDPVGAARIRIRRVLDAVRRQEAGFVHVSSFTTLPLPDTASPGAALRHGLLQGSHPYFRLKAEVEAEVRAALDAGMPGTIVLPAACYGPYDMKPRRATFIPSLVAGDVSVIVRRRINVLDVRDLGDVVAALVARGLTQRHVPVFGHDVCVASFCDQVCRIAGVPSPAIAVPSVFGAVGSYWFETLCAMSGRAAPWPSLPALLVQSGHPARPSPGQLAVQERLRPLETTLLDALEWYRSIGYI